MVAVALKGGDADVAAATAELQRRRDLLLAELDGLHAVPPHGGWSLLLDAQALGHDAVAASALLLDRARAAATPMTGWGQQTARYVRLVFANEPMERLEGIGERVRSALT